MPVEGEALLYDAEGGDMTIAVAGDAMISRRMRAFRELHFLKLVEIMGFDAVLTANNHAYDFPEGGFLTTLRHLEKVDLPHAGSGQDLDHSRAPAYVDSPRGRVAVMSASSTFTDVSRAGPGRPDFPGRPGINALRHDLVHHVTQDVFDALHKANRTLGLEAQADALAQFGFTGHSTLLDKRTAMKFLEREFRVAEACKIETAVNKDDLGRATDYATRHRHSGRLHHGSVAVCLLGRRWRLCRTG